MPQYQYVDKAGALKTVEANDPSSAMSSATDIAGDSGVSAVSTPVAQTSPTVQTPATTTPVSTPAPTPVATPIKRTVRIKSTDKTNDPNSFENVYQEQLTAAQDSINSLSDYYGQQLKEQSVVNENNNRATQSVSTLSGLAGSTEANVQEQKTTAAGVQANKSILAEKEMKVQELLGKVRESAVAESRARREEASKTETERIAARKAAKEEAASTLSQLATAGVTYEGLRTSDPTSYQHLVDTYGSEDALKGAFILNTPQDQIIDKKIEGGKYIIAKQNPITGKINVETLDLGLPENYTKTIDAGDRLLAIPDNWDGDTSKLITINKGLEPGKVDGGVNIGDSEYAGIINTILGSGKFTKEQTTLVKNAIANGEDPMTVIKNQAKNILGTEGKTLTQLEQAKTSMQALDQNLKAFYAAGGKSNIFSGNFEKVANRLGEVNDPNLVGLAVKVASSLQKYRNAISGTAYSEQEGRDIASIFPGITKGEILNNTIVKARLETLDSDIDGAYRQALGSAYDTLKAQADKPKTLQEYYDKSPENAQRVEQLLSENSELSKEDVWQILNPSETSFKPVGNTLASKGIVGGYDITSYATDPAHEKRVATIYNGIGTVNTPEQADSYIQSIAPKSPVKGSDVIKAAKYTGVSPAMILAIMQQDSTFGTAGKAVRTKNPGNVGNTDSGATKAFNTWTEGVYAVANNLKKRKITSNS